MDLKNTTSMQDTLPNNQVIVKPAAKVDFTSAEIRSKLVEVKAEVREVLESANIDSKNLSLNFTV